MSALEIGSGDGLFATEAKNYVGKIITFRKTIEELTEDESAEIFKLYKQVYESYENKSGL